MNKREKKEIKVRYSPEQFEKLKEKAEKSKQTLNEYQIDISKRAEVKIELEDKK